MIFAADIDQFCTVKRIARYTGYNNIISFFNIRDYHNMYGSITYIPREFFNITQITTINFDFVKYQKNYNTRTRVINNGDCKWINLTNLTTKYYLICKL